MESVAAGGGPKPAPVSLRRAPTGVGDVDRVRHGGAARRAVGIVVTEERGRAGERAGGGVLRLLREVINIPSPDSMASMLALRNAAIPMPTNMYVMPDSCGRVAGLFS